MRGYYSIENTFADPDYSVARFAALQFKHNTNNDTLSKQISNYEISCYPNPFNPTTTITYSIQEPGLVNIKVFDLTGQEVADLVNEEKEAGNYSIKFDASGLPSGIYIYKIDTGNFTQSRKMLLMK